MMQRKWISKELDSIESWNEIKNGIAALRPKVAAFDTETTGLHIVLDKPFIFQFGFLHPNNDKGYTFLVDLRYNKDAKRIIKEWLEIAKTCDVYLGHNVKFDLHMLKNIGIEYDTENLSDTQFYIRWGSDSLHTNEGGPPLSLKDYATRYVDGSAKYHEKLRAPRAQILVVDA